MSTEHLKDTLELYLNPLIESVNEMKVDLKQLKEASPMLRIENLEKSKEKYKDEFLAVKQKVAELSIKMEKQESAIFNLNEKIEVNIRERKEHFTKLEESLKKLTDEMAIVLLISKNPRMAIAIAIGLYLFAISDIFPKILGNIF